MLSGSLTVVEESTVWKVIVVAAGDRLALIQYSTTSILSVRSIEEDVENERLLVTGEHVRAQAGSTLSFVPFAVPIKEMFEPSLSVE